MAAKRLITVALLVFVISALATQAFLSFRRPEATVIPDGQNLLLFHAQTRCATCRDLEKTIRNLIEQSLNTQQNGEKIALILIAYDAPENHAVAEQFHVGAITVILVENQNGKIIRRRDLSQEVWLNLQDERAMTEMLSNEIQQFLNPSQLNP